MERDVTYIREELEEVILNQLRRWEDVIEQEEAVTLSRSGVEALPGLLWHLSSARDALVKAEGVLVGGEAFSTADTVLGFRQEPERDDGRIEQDRVVQDDVEEEILARFTSTGEIEFEERSDGRDYGRSSDCYRA
ncbi:hypothetical protein [Pseudovibrio sp. Tun.PSC04-5.I4]|uniref:hypothetical protein n=1 Tax=Pseudovibrio sp. Tun.PSC04-5.I4 TaxID=1798213 RepID=UPI0008825ECE|nr:hypothetical protein [Pseudovibrio sp. Tun.PSC04-5.I4]SDR36479.1 hypothetical protein SAMN04515695_4983 [Pseudovibrio sp. Tun.PSC04-5.I4]